MTKAQIHFSNHLESLVEVLKKELFPKDAAPFDKRLIVVPHLGLKSYLMQQIALDPSLQIAAGFQVVNLVQGYAKITKKKLPSSLELSLFLQHALIPMIEKEDELKAYFNSESKEKRLGLFSDLLAQHFLRYGIFGKKPLKPWLEVLWQQVTKRWPFPKEKADVNHNWQIHLFGFGWLPSAFFSVFEGAQFYFFSPSFAFLGDFYSKKEASFLAKKLKPSERVQLEEYALDQNRYLASWGKIGRNMQRLIEEDNFLTLEHYVNNVEENSSLHNMQQALVEGTAFKAPKDPSICCFSASTRLREVEYLKEILFELFEKEVIQPCDVHVFAPDISLYAPFIQATFEEVDIAISDLEMEHIDPVAKAFGKLLSLPQKRFALDAVLHLFNQPPLREKFDLDVALMRRWLEKANVRFGLSKEQRKTLYLQDIEESHIANTLDTDTWKRGLKRLILGLGYLEGEEEPLPLVDPSDMEQFDKLYRLIQALGDDLSVFYNGTKWTIPHWLRYFAGLLERYFLTEPGHNLHTQLQELAANSDHLDKEEVSFSSVQRVLTRLLGKKNQSHQSPHLQAIRFGSLSEGCVQPAKVIWVLGMDESFPRKEETSSLYAGEIDYRPKKGEEDRFLFLQLLSSARSYFFLSFVEEPSTIVEEFLDQYEGNIERIPPEVRQHYTRPPLLPDFFGPIKLDSASQPKEIDIQKLFKFARHPLRYYLHEVLGIVPEFKGKNHQEFILDPLTKYKLVREAFKYPLEIVFEKALKRGDLPPNMLCSLAKEQIAKEIELYEAFPEEIQIDPIQIGDIKLVGKLDNYTKHGLLARGKDCLEDRIRFWPQGLIAKALGLPLKFLKDKKEVTIDGSIEEYLHYFCIAHNHPSPLLPSFAKALLEGTSQDLKKALKSVEDETWGYLFFRDPFPNVEVIHANWSEYLRSIFEGVYATV